MDRELDDVDLVYSPGEQATVRLRHAGPVGFLAAKAAALENRAEHKDGYDSLVVVHQCRRHAR